VSVLSQAWGIAPLDAKAQVVRLAQAATALVRALGGAPPSPPTTASSSDDVEAWETAYEQSAATVDGPSVDTLSGLPRNDNAVLTWAASVQRYNAAPAAVRAAVQALQSAYASLGNTVRSVVDDAAIRRWLSARADRAGWPITSPLPPPVRPAPSSSGSGKYILVAVVAMLAMRGRGRR